MTYFNYSLLLNELKRPKEALQQMAKAYTYLPENDRIVYNYALLVYQNGNSKKAKSIVAKQLKVSKSPDLVNLMNYFNR